MLGTELMEALRPGNEVTGMDLPDIDITRAETCFAAVERHLPKVVINSAAFTRVDDCESQPEKAFLVNGTGAGNVARAAASAGSIFVHYSTDYVFDGAKSEPYMEMDSPNPKSVYGQSKLAGEDQVHRYCPNHMILRTSWLFGRNGANFIRTIVAAARTGAHLRVVNDQRGSPTFAKDLARWTRLMIESGCRGTYHVTNSGSCTWFDLASRAVEWAGLGKIPIAPVATSEFQRPAPRPANSILANARLEREGFSLMRPWEEAAREYVEEDLSED
jgi:dTDP-4-dehydrorhamnose reductase